MDQNEGRENGSGAILKYAQLESYVGYLSM